MNLTTQVEMPYFYVISLCSSNSIWDQMESFMWQILPSSITQEWPRKTVAKGIPLGGQDLPLLVLFNGKSDNLCTD